MKLIFCIILCLYCNFTYGQKQDIQKVEEKIETLITKTRGYINIYNIVSLISWDSHIIHYIPSVPPYEPQDYRNITISSSFGNRRHPITQEYKHHTGIDLPMQLNDTVCATANGTIEVVGKDSKLGNYIKIAHKYGFKTIYGHLSKNIACVGDSVNIGQPIGLSGNTGLSTGPHLHYSIQKNGLYENPYNYCFLYYNYLKNKHNITILQ